MQKRYNGLMADVVLQSRLVDADGNAVGEAVSEAQLMPLTPAEVEQEIHLKNPRLWNIDTPYMYRVESILKNNRLARYSTVTILVTASVLSASMHKRIYPEW